MGEDRIEDRVVPLDLLGASASTAAPARLTARVEKRLLIVWVGTHDPPEACIASWRDAHPSWEFTLVRTHEGWANQHIIDAIIASESARGQDWGAAVCDVIRWELLSSQRGGIVVDADSTCLRALDAQNATDELQVDLFDHEAWAVADNEQKAPGRVATHAMGASPRSAVFARCVEEVSQVNVAAIPPGQVREFVGAGLLSRVFREFEPGVLNVLPSKLFIPVHWSGAIAADVVVPGGGVRTPVYASQGFGYRKGYNHLRRWPCQCAKCRLDFGMFMAPWT
jgi:hypothetical protein